MNVCLDQVDYLERAKCREEIPLLEKQAELENIEKQKFWDEMEQTRVSYWFYADCIRFENLGFKIIDISWV